MRDQYDVIVVGSGAAGLCAAAVAAKQSQTVLLLESASLIGGTTAISGGMVWVPANHKMQEIGLDDSLENTKRYLQHTVTGSDEKMEAFLATSDEAIRYLEQHTSLKLRPVKRYPDYYPDLPGATLGGRVLEPVPFDGSELGAHFAHLRWPLPEFMLFGAMMISREDIPHLRRVGQSLQSTMHTFKLVAQYAKQRMRHLRGTTLYLGNALAGRLYKSVLDLGVEVRVDTSVVRLLSTSDRCSVTGVEVRDNGQLRQFFANKAVILATGGLSHSTALRRHYIPEGVSDVTACAESESLNRGAELALDATDVLLSAPTQQGGFWVPASVFQRADHSLGVYPHTVTDRAKPGLIAVNQQGRRFVNEAVSYHEFVKAQVDPQNHAVPAYLICDSRFLWKYGLGKIKPFTYRLDADIASGYLKRAETLEDLGGKLGLPINALASTVNTFNQYAASGEDPEFGRGANAYQRHLGDADQQPNPCVAVIARAPFYAVEVIPSDLGMSAGMQTDVHARVLGADNRPITGLYACGNDMASVMNGAYPGPGITLGPALTFAYIAAKHAARRL
ncbi:putative FAD-binding dehydrogenase [Burkholderiaceae bacterium]